LGAHIKRDHACELAAAYRAEVLKGTAGIGKKVPKDISFEAARTAFEQWAEADRKPKTVKSYKECLRRLAESFAGKTLRQITEADIEHHRLRRIEAGGKIRSNRELAVLKNLFNRCRALKTFDGANPVNAVKFRQEPKGRLRFLEQEEADRLLEAAPEPLRSMILLALHTGLRVQSELLTLQWRDVDLRRRTVTVTSQYAKNSRIQPVPLNSLAYEALKRLPKRGPYVFTHRNGQPYRSIRTTFATACTKAKLKDVTPHVLRHTFATGLLERGVDARAVQELGRWSKLAMLERYGHVSLSRKAEAIEKLVSVHPLSPVQSHYRARVPKRRAAQVS
jgi:integrase